MHLLQILFSPGCISWPLVSLTSYGDMEHLPEYIAAFVVFTSIHSFVYPFIQSVIRSFIRFFLKFLVQKSVVIHTISNISLLHFVSFVTSSSALLSSSSQPPPIVLRRETIEIDPESIVGVPQTKMDGFKSVDQVAF